MRAIRTAVLLMLVLTAAFSGAAPAAEPAPSVRLPWKEAGLTEREAAAHLLDRFAHGARPGEVDRVVAMGLDRWFERQLAGGFPEPAALTRRLERAPALAMSAEEILATYPPAGRVLVEARAAGVIPEGLDRDGMSDDQRREVRQAVLRFAREKGYRPQRELQVQLMAQKLLRAVHSESQLAEVMADFWYNHFNVSSTDNQSRPHLLSYERDAIRPPALGRFRDLLGATAKHPAMLLYLDNARSSAAPESPTTLALRRRPQRAGRRPRGLNENYARELLELHTLGVDGGYTQQDVVEVARAFTGWSVLPAGEVRERAERRLAQARHAGGAGFVVEGSFLFRADQHDAGAKTVLGTRLPAGRGIEDGEQVLDLVAGHRATARHLARKLAVRFVSDDPPAALVERLARAFEASGGDTRAVLCELVQSPELWRREARAAKVKSPFELAASALRGLGAEVGDPRDTLRWIARMGQPLYAYQAPTGFPDRAEAWVSTGSLLNRMNFGLQLAAGRVSGVEIDLPALNGGREPESREEALRVYGALLLPGRDLKAALAPLEAVVRDPELAKKVDAAAPAEAAPAARATVSGSLETGMSIDLEGLDEETSPAVAAPPIDRDPPTPLEQVVGVLLGSPEFQRR